MQKGLDNMWKKWWDQNEKIDWKYIQTNKTKLIQMIDVKIKDFEQFIMEIKKSDFIEISQQLYDKRLKRAKQLNLPGLPTQNQARFKQVLTNEHQENEMPKTLRGGGKPEKNTLDDAQKAIQGLKNEPSIKKNQRTQGILRSMGAEGYLFSDLQKPVFRKFSRSSPVWRIIHHGLNFQGTCPNKNCDAYNQRVWIRKGYGTSNMHKQLRISECPICKKIAGKVYNIGIYQAEVQIDGEVQVLSISNNDLNSRACNPSQKWTKRYIHTDQTGITTFDQDCQHKIQSNWFYQKSLVNHQKKRSTIIFQTKNEPCKDDLMIKINYYLQKYI